MAESLKATVGKRPAPARRRKQLIERFLMCLWVKRCSDKVLPLLPRPWRGGRRLTSQEHVFYRRTYEHWTTTEPEEEKRGSLPALQPPGLLQHKPWEDRGKAPRRLLGLSIHRVVLWEESLWLLVRGEPSFPAPTPALSTCLGDVSAISQPAAPRDDP